MNEKEKQEAMKKYENVRKVKSEMVQEITPSETSREFVDGRDYSYP